MADLAPWDWLDCIACWLLCNGGCSFINILNLVLCKPKIIMIVVEWNAQLMTRFYFFVKLISKEYLIRIPTEAHYLQQHKWMKLILIYFVLVVKLYSQTSLTLSLFLTWTPAEDHKRIASIKILGKWLDIAYNLAIVHDQWQILCVQCTVCNFVSPGRSYTWRSWHNLSKHNKKLV